jgi:hypothetical protein
MLNYQRVVYPKGTSPSLPVTVFCRTFPLFTGDETGETGLGFHAVGVPWPDQFQVVTGSVSDISEIYDRCICL